jgi:hypothetical protein
LFLEVDECRMSVYLDEYYWAAERGSLVGPPGVVSQAVVENEGFVYRPLCDYHLSAPSTPESFDIESVWGRESCASIPEARSALPKLASGIPGDPSAGLPGVPDSSWLVVLARHSGAHAVAVLSQQTTAADLAHVHMFRVSDSGLIPQPLRDCLWHWVCHELARNGFVGMTALYAGTAEDQRYVSSLGFFDTVERHAERRGHADKLAALRSERVARING